MPNPISDFINDLINPVKGFGVTFTEMFRKVETVEYPEDKRPTAPRFHGHHQLNRWPDGLEKCIGCELCAWACPADAIYVEGRDNTAEARFSPGERYGAVYQINYLRCILCGMCIEACPTRALTMTNEYEIADDSRENLIWTKEQLLAPLQSGMEAPPHAMRLGDDEKDYYRLGAAGVVAGPRAPGMAGPGGPTGAAVFAGAQGAPATPGVREIDVEVADDSAGQASMPDFGEEPPVRSRVSRSTHAPVKGDDGT